MEQSLTGAGATTHLPFGELPRASLMVVAAGRDPSPCLLPAVSARNLKAHPDIEPQHLAGRARGAEA